MHIGLEKKKRKQETARCPSMQEWLKKTVIHPYHELQLSNEKELSMQDTFPAWISRALCQVEEEEKNNKTTFQKVTNCMIPFI